MPKVTCVSRPLGQSVGMLRTILGSQRNLMKKIESEIPELLAHSKVFQPIYNAAKLASEWRQGVSTKLTEITKSMEVGDMENVLATIIDPLAGTWHNITTAQRAQGAALKKLWSDMLQKTAGLSEADADRFITKDFAALRQAGGDLNRFGGIRNSYPESFHPLFEEILDGGLNVNNSNALGVTWDLIHMGERLRWLKPARDEAFKEVSRWKNIKGMEPNDVLFAQSRAKDWLEHMVHQRDSQRTYFTKTIESTINQMNGVLGKDKVDIDSNTIQRWAANMSSWYGGMAMAYRPALAIRNMTQVLLPMAKVGYGRGGRALKMTYGKDREKHIAEALGELGIPLKGESAVYIGEGSEGQLGRKLFRDVKRLQNTGMIPFRWADRVNNRVTTYNMGKLAIKEEAPALLSGKISWEEFMMRTGLAGSMKVDQRRIHSLLMGVERHDVTRAAREYGKELVADTQFIYDSVNSPLAFRGTAGRMFGQFGTWPLSFAEFMHQNITGADKAWTQKFLGNYAIGKGALGGVGLATGIDTSSWNFANPLTFQGGPWFQTMRDITVLGTSQNEFERRQARGLVNRMFGVTGTPYTTVFNPIGSVTADMMQALAAQSPVEAALLGMGFNTRSSSVATRR